MLVLVLFAGMCAQFVDTEEATSPEKRTETVNRGAQFASMRECLQGIERDSGSALIVMDDSPDAVGGVLKAENGFGGTFDCRRKDSGTRGTLYEGRYSMEVDVNGTPTTPPTRPETARREERAPSPQKAQPLSVEIERYQETADSGANVKVRNPNATHYNSCSIELGEEVGKPRWFLPNPTAIDAKGTRSYPTFLFRDRKGISPPSAPAIRYAVIDCASPRLRQELSIR